MVLWILGGLALLWWALGAAMVPAIGRMMQSSMMGDGMACRGGAMTAMMGIQVVVMLGLTGIFIFLVTDTHRGRRDGRA